MDNSTLVARLVLKMMETHIAVMEHMSVAGTMVRVSSIALSMRSNGTLRRPFYRLLLRRVLYGAEECSYIYWG